MTDRWHLTRIALVLVLIMAVSACNYRFGGYREGKAGVETVSIPPFENRTRQIGIETLFTNEMVYEVGRGDRLALSSPGKADAVVHGVIRDLKANTISRQNLNVSLERRVYVTVELTAKDQQGEAFWHYQITEDEVYFVEPDKVSTEANLREALAEISRRIAEKFHYRFTQEF